MGSVRPLGSLPRQQRARSHRHWWCLSHTHCAALGSHRTSLSLGFPICAMGDRACFTGFPRRIQTVEARGQFTVTWLGDEGLQG